MNFFKNKYFLALAFVVSIFFLSISLGGEFFHDRIHHHATQQDHDGCPVYQLALQLFLFTVVFSFALPLFSNQETFVVHSSSILRLCCAFPSLRAPPTSF